MGEYREALGRDRVTSINPLLNPIVTPVGARLGKEIEAAIETYPGGRLKQLVDAMPEPLVIKYVPAKWAKDYIARGAARLKISTSPGFTWGTGTYVTPLAFPISSAIFGRVGVVAQFDPAGWRIFDATDAWVQELYMDWVRSQPLGRTLILTTHSQLANQFLRDLFRKAFRIDCVLFRPDEFGVPYTDIHEDVWMNVTDWLPSGEISRDYSDRLADPRFAVLVSEEFSGDQGGVERKTLIGPMTAKQSNADIMRAVRNAYRSGNHVVIDA